MLGHFPLYSLSRADAHHIWSYTLGSRNYARLYFNLV